MLSGRTPVQGASLEEQAIEPMGESVSDYEAVGEVAKKLGLYEEYAGRDDRQGEDQALVSTSWGSSS